MTVVLAVCLASFAAVALMGAVASLGRSTGEPTPHARSTSTTRVACRILFVTARGDDLVLDCIAVHSHPSQSVAAPGTPFAVRVGVLGSSWFGTAMEDFVRRLAEEDRVVAFEPATGGPHGDHLDVRSADARMRFDLHDWAELQLGGQA